MLLPAAARPSSPPSHQRVLNVAHRGASEEAPENTLAAVRRAVAVGADQVEVDVQRSKDGALVLVHDTTLARTTNVKEVFPGRAPWRVADLTYAELSRLDAGAWKSPTFAGEPVPTLEQVVELVRHGSTGLLVELKAPELYPGVVRDLVATLRGVRGYVDEAVDAGKLVVESFGFAAMKEHKTLEPRVPVGLLGAPGRANLPALATWADQVNPSHLTVDRSYVDEVHRLGMGCLMWTVNRGPAIRRALHMGADGIITNRPRLLGRILESRVGAGAR